MRKPVFAAFLYSIACLVSNASFTLAEYPPGGINVVASVQTPDVTPGGSTDLLVMIRLPTQWIVYDIEQAPNTVLPTRIEVDSMGGIGLAESFRSEGAIEAPEARFGNRIVRYFEVSPTFRRPLLVSNDATLGNHRIRGRVTFLAKHQPSGRFYVVNDVPFETTVVVVEESGNRADMPSPTNADDQPSDIKTLIPKPTPRDHQPQRAMSRADVPTIRIAVTAGSDEIHPSRPDPPLFSPWLIGLLLALTGVAVGIALPPATRHQPGSMSVPYRRRAA